MSVAIGLITRKDVDLETVKSLLEARGDPLVVNIILRDAGPYLDDERNRVVQDFINDTEADWLLFVDSDIGFTAKDIHILIPDTVEPENRCVSGVYLRAVEPLVPVVYDYNRDSCFFDPIPYEDLVERPRDDQGYVAVDAVGAGFLGVHRTLLEEMLVKWDAPKTPFAEQVINGVACGEDFTFCARIRQMGYPVLVHPDVKVSHLKFVRLHIKD